MKNQSLDQKEEITSSSSQYFMDIFKPVSEPNRNHFSIVGSYCGYETCPNCSQQMHIDYYYRFSEGSKFCEYCGYFYSFYWKKDDAGELIPLPNPTGSKYWEDRFEAEEKENKHPCGCLHIDTGGPGIHLDSLENLLSEDQLHDIISNDEILSAAISKRNPENKTIEVDIIKGAGRLSYDNNGHEEVDESA